jgi:hypothetical protein
MGLGGDDTGRTPAILVSHGNNHQVMSDLDGSSSVIAVNLTDILTAPDAPKSAHCWRKCIAFLVFA